MEGGSFWALLAIVGVVAAVVVWRRLDPPASADKWRTTEKLSASMKSAQGATVRAEKDFLRGVTIYVDGELVASRITKPGQVDWRLEPYVRQLIKQLMVADRQAESKAKAEARQKHEDRMKRL